VASDGFGVLARRRAGEAQPHGRRYIGSGEMLEQPHGDLLAELPCGSSGVRDDGRLGRPVRSDRVHHGGGCAPAPLCGARRAAPTPRHSRIDCPRSSRSNEIRRARGQLKRRIGSAECARARDQARCLSMAASLMMRVDRSERGGWEVAARPARPRYLRYAAMSRPALGRRSGRRSRVSRDPPAVRFGGRDRHMDAFALGELRERFDLVYDLGILHRVEYCRGAR